MHLLDLIIYSAETATPRQFDAIQSLLTGWRDERGIMLRVVSFDPDKHGAGSKVLVLGSTGPVDHHLSVSFQYTYSPAQFESRANSATVFNAALDSYFEVERGLHEGESVLDFWYAEFMAFRMESFDLTQPIAVDVETGGVLGENVSARTAPMLTIAFAQGNVAMVCKLTEGQNTSYRDDEDRRRERERYDGVLEWLREILPKIEKPIFHNGKFDIQVIEANTGIRMPNWFDTMLAHHVLFQAAREHGLKALCKRYFDAPDWESDIKKWIKGSEKDYAKIPRGILAQYNGYDVLWTYRLWEKLQVMIDADDNAQMALYLEMQAAEFLSDVEAVGIPVSGGEINDLLLEYEGRKEVSLLRLQEITGSFDFNPGSWQQVKKWLQGQGVVVSSTDEDSINAIMEQYEHDERIRGFCKDLLRYRKMQKMSGTYVTPWWEAAQIEGDNRAHPSFHIHGTTTGRLSSSDPNAQNVPRDKTIRRMVTLDGSNELKL